MSPESPLGQQALDEYLSALASSQPAPGGGSGTAVAGAIGAALGEMVCNVTLARPSAPNRDELDRLRSRASQLRGQFMRLATDDEHAYGQYRTATRLPKTTDAEKQRRQSAIQQSLAEAATVPLALVQACNDLMDTLIEIAHLGSRSVVSDAQTGAYLAAATVQAAALNLHANAGMLDDQATATRLVNQFETIATSIPVKVQAVDDAAKSR